jgi:NAD(P)H-dependent flavin oxidoreductase YrpB (nitropropane dioxygenase family)
MTTLPPTAFTRLLGCRLPLQQAGMGAITTPALAGAVAAEGGLGMIAAAGLAPDEVDAQIRSALELGGPGARVGVNFLVPFLDHSALDTAAAAAALVECFYGHPDQSIVERIHAAGTLAGWQVGSLVEARMAYDAGCDVIVVQGREAGGHVRGRSPLLPLLRDVRRALDAPLVAAGGIGSGATMAGAMLAGADAVRIGTRFVATVEADTHPDYAGALVAAAGAHDTVLAETFVLGWPDAPHRVLQSCIDASGVGPSSRSPLPPTRAFAGDVARAALYAGESVGDVKAIVPAATVIREIVRDAEFALQDVVVER